MSLSNTETNTSIVIINHTYIEPPLRVGKK